MKKNKFTQKISLFGTYVIFYKVVQPCLNENNEKINLKKHELLRQEKNGENGEGVTISAKIRRWRMCGDINPLDQTLLDKGSLFSNPLSNQGFLLHPLGYWEVKRP